VGSIWSAAYSFALGVLPAAIAALTRGGAATRIGPTGNREFGPHNLFTFSSDFTNAAWTKTAGLVFGATTIQDPNSSGFKTVNRFVSGLPANSTFTFSVRVKKESTRTEFGGINILLSGGSTLLSYVGIDEVLGTAFQLAGTTVTPTITVTENTATDFVVNVTVTDTASNTLCQVFLYGTLSLNGITLGNGPGSVRTYTEATLKYGSVAGTVPTTTAARFLPRIEHSPVSPFSPVGLLVEGQATQLAQSGNIGGAFITQTKTVTAAAHTISFYGTGSVVLSGVHSATVNGTGANVLTSLTFTPSAGSLTMTPSGTVTDGQLELGTVATSRIPNPTTGTMVRVGDFAGGGLTGAALTDLITPTSPFTIRFAYRKAYSQASNETLFGLCAGASAGGTNQLQLVTNGTQARLIHSGGSGALTGTLTHNGTTTNVIAVSVDPVGAKMSISVNGGTAVETTGIAYTGAGVTAMVLGARNSAGTDPAVRFTVDPIQSNRRYITGAALQALSV
jgi:hypothetical protein